MRALRAAIIAALSIFGTGSEAQDVTLTSGNGGIEIEGDLLGFDGEFYRLETVYGELTIDASGVLCEGPGCPNLDAFVAELRVSGATVIGEVLFPALIEAFASRAGLKQRRVGQDDSNVIYELSDDTRVVARFSVRLSNTDEAFADLLADEADMAMATREIRSDEARRAREAGLGQLTDVKRSRILALDGLVAVTAPGHPVGALSVDTLSRVLAGQVANWQELGGPDAPIEVHMTDEQTGVSQAVDDQIMRPVGRLLSDTVIRHSTPAAVSGAVARDFLGLGVTTYAARGNAHVVTITGPCGFDLQAGRQSIKTEDYPLTAPLFLYLPARRMPKLARDFMAFTQTNAAQFVTRRAGFVDLAAEEVSINHQGDRIANAIKEAGEEISLDDLQRMISTLAGMNRLTTSFRFEPGSAGLDAQSRSNVLQMARLLESGDFDGRSVVFAGFSDGQGPASTNLRIARQRAQAVHDAVLEAAQTADLSRIDVNVEAFGEVLPMACDDTAWGRGVNRRVEIWVR